MAAGTNYPDALSAGAAAAASESPALLLDGGRDAVEKATSALLQPTAIQRLTVAGGASVISESLRTDPERFTTTRDGYRYGGADRFDTNRLISESAFQTIQGPVWGTAFVASGFGFADAFAGVPLAVRYSAPTLLAQKSCIPRRRSMARGRSTRAPARSSAPRPCSTTRPLD